MTTRTFTRTRTRATARLEYRAPVVSLIGSLALGIVALFLSPLLLFPVVREKFSGVFGGEGGLKPYDSLTDKEHDEIEVM